MLGERWCQNCRFCAVRKETTHRPEHFCEGRGEPGLAPAFHAFCTRPEAPLSSQTSSAQVVVLLLRSVMLPANLVQKAFLLIFATTSFCMKIPKTF